MKSVPSPVSEDLFHASISERMLVVCVHLSLAGSGLTSLISAASHMSLGVNKVVPAIEFAQFLLEVVLWITATSTKKYSLIFPLQMTGAFVGMSAVLLLGGDLFLSNLFWIALLAPVLIVTGYRWYGLVLFLLTWVLIAGFFTIYSPHSESMAYIFAIDAALFNIGLFVFVLVLRRYTLQWEREAATSNAKAVSVEQTKNSYLLHLNHELRNPLTAVVASADLLSKLVQRDSHEASRLSPEKLAQRQVYLAKTIQSTTHELLGLLSDVLDMERLQAGVIRTEMSEFCVDELLAHVVSMHHAKAASSGNTIGFEVRGGTQNRWIGPPVRIRQILVNLLSNSLKYAPGTAINVVADEARGSLVLRVIDHGPGMSQTSLDHLYEAFSSSMGAHGSTGLGLRICYLIATKELKGDINVNSGPNGTTFTVSLPLAKAI